MSKRHWQFGLICFVFLILASNAFAGAWLPTKSEYDAQADGTIDSIIYTAYNVSGYPIEVRSDSDADGTIDSIIYTRYDIDGYTSIAEQDLDADGTIDSVIYASMDAGGKRIIIENDDDADGTIDSFEFTESDGKYPVQTIKYYIGTGKYEGVGTQTSESYHTYDSNCNEIKEEEDNDLDGQIDEVTYTTYHASGLIKSTQTDSDNDGDIDVNGQYTWDEKGLPLRSEVDTQGVASGIAYTSNTVMDFDNTYDANGNAVTIRAHMDATTTLFGQTQQTETDTVSYYTYEYFEGAEESGGEYDCGGGSGDGGGDGGGDGNQDGWETIRGTVTFDGAPVCAMALANGQYMFTCRSGDDFGKYELNVPLDGNDQITLQVFVSGLAPFRQVTSASDLDVDVQMQATSPDSQAPTVSTQTVADSSVPAGRARITGTVTFEGAPLCAMVLANGQYMFSCGGNSGIYDLTVPLDGNGQITLYVFVSGKQPYRQTFTP